MLEKGLIQKWIKMYFPPNTCPALKTQANTVVLPLSDTAGVFIMLGLGIAMATGMIAWEVIIRKIHQNRKK